jgi:hypothetical protein
MRKPSGDYETGIRRTIIPASIAPRGVTRGPGKGGTAVARTRLTMHPILKAGILVGGLCSVWMFVFGFAGWYKNPAMSPLFFLVVVIELGGLLWGLRQTAREGRNYSAQVVAGTMMAIVAGVIIIVSSLIFTGVVFPDAVDYMRANDPSATSMSGALNGFIGTLITGIVASAVIAVWVRAPRASAPVRT